MKVQKNTVLSSEADAWFIRNKESILLRTDFSHLDSILNYLKPKDDVLEIGASFGYNLNYLLEKKKISGFGLGPSRLAVEFGQEKYPRLKLKVGTIDEADLFDQKFQSIIIGFCLYLVDPELLPEIIYRIDKALCKGGFLHIIDFDSKYLEEKSYSHHSGIITRKMDYSSIFLSLPNYFLVEKKSWSHFGNSFHVDKNERCSTVTLFKQ
jgi:cyclopropane fatty-acyl-phospholipid synthase-like methyltransferase